MSELSRTDVEDIVKRVLNETLDKKHEELVQKLRIFVDMTLNKILETKLKNLLEQLKSGLSEGSTDNSSYIREVMRELNAVSESCNELLDKVDSLELRLEEP